MRKIYLFCALGMSTSVLVKNMQEASKELNYNTEINAYPISEAVKFGAEADILLLGPQVKFQLKKVQAALPEKLVFAIDMRDYGRMNGKNVIQFVKEKLGD